MTVQLNILASLVLCAGVVFADETPVQKTEDQRILEILQISDDPAIQSTILFADKQNRALYIFDKNTSAPEKFEIDIGKNDGNKTKRDDKKTPEGIYLLEKKLLPPEIPYELYGSMAFTTNYPNVFDKFENKSGSGIWLHSVPDTVPLTRGSRGCVVVRNDHIKTLSEKINLNKSYLIINDKARWVSATEHDQKKDSILNWLTNWKDTWQSQDLGKYIQLYSDDFSAPNFNKKSWLNHKEKLKGKYKYVKISLGKPHIFHEKNQYVIKFTQDYESDGHQDRGIKVLFLIEEGNEIRILREEWSPLTS